MNVDKQFLIHVATEIIIITTVTVFINKRITKLEKALLDQQYKTRELEYKLHHLEQLVSSRGYLPQPSTVQISRQPSKQHQHQQNPLPEKKQPSMFGIPGIQSLFNMFDPGVAIHRNSSTNAHTDVNVEIIPEEEKQPLSQVVVEDEEDEKLVEEALNTILADDNEEKV